MHPFRRPSAFLLVVALAVLPVRTLGDTTTTVRNVSGVELIMSGVTVSRTTHRARRHRATTKGAGPRPALARADTQTQPPAQPDTLRDAERLVRTALAFVGTPYVWGGASPGGFDCSGFTSYVYARLGITIPRTADVQFAAGRPVSQPLPGDLVFFQTYDWGASHVGIYLGDGRFVNSIGSNVHVTTFASEYFRSRYLGARRFLPG